MHTITLLMYLYVCPEPGVFVYSYRYRPVTVCYATCVVDIYI